MMRPPPDNRLRAGFTLVEMSIVLVIIGLIIGAIFVGNNLITAARDRAFFSQIEKLDSAINTFKLKFNCIPGDCAFASDIVGACTPYPPTTCNGDGNGFITALTSDGTNHMDRGNPIPATAPGLITDVTGEGALVWTHLKLAKLYTDVSSLGTDNGGYALNFPLMANSHEWLALAAWSGRHYYRTGFTGVDVQSLRMCRYSFTPADVYYIGTKIGQTTFTITTTGGAGDPDAVNRGDKLIVTGNHPACASNGDYFYPPSTGAAGTNACLTNTATPNTLNLSNNEKQCNLMIRADF